MSSADNSAKAKASSFSSNTSKQIKGNKRIKPLTREFFTLLIKLEADFNNKQYTVGTLDELIQYYAKAVEYYDSIKDEISSYFIFKIQDILATKKSLKMLLEQNNKAGARQANHNEEESSSSGAGKKVTFSDSAEKKAEVIKENIIEESSGEEDEGEKHVTALEKMRRAAKKVDRKNRISISTMKNEKQRFVNFFYKMETQKASEKQTMKALMNDFSNTSDKNDIFAKKDIDNQRDKLRKRLEKRKADTFMSHTMNTYSFHAGPTENNDIFENFLDELNGHDESGSKPSNIEGSERLDTDGDNIDFKPDGDGGFSPAKFIGNPMKFDTPSFNEGEGQQKGNRKDSSSEGKLGGGSPKNINNPEAIKGQRAGAPTKSE